MIELGYTYLEGPTSSTIPSISHEADLLCIFQDSEKGSCLSSPVFVLVRTASPNKKREKEAAYPYLALQYQSRAINQSVNEAIMGGQALQTFMEICCA